MGSFGEKCHNFGLAIFNPKEGKFIGRTCKSWTLIFLYYCVYYACLAGFWIGMLSCFLYGVIDTRVPTRTGMQSLLKLNPGLGILPPTDTDATLTQITIYKGKLQDDYIDYMEKFLGSYDDGESNCNFTSGERLIPDLDLPCKFPKSLLGPCSDPRKFIETDKNVCIYLKLNKVFGYLPDIEGNEIQIKCGAANPHDELSLGEPVFYPASTNTTAKMGYFSSVVFPYVNQPDYQSPLLAVTFPDIRKNTVVMVNCDLVNTGDHGGFRFDLAVDTTEFKA